MTLQASGVISMQDVFNELGGGTVGSLGDAGIRHLALKTSGAISLTDLYGKNAAIKSVWVRSTGSGNIAFDRGLNCDIRPATIAGHAIGYFGQSGANFVVETDGGLTKPAFTSITINGATFNSASSTFTDTGAFGTSAWTWAGGAASSALVANTIYPITIT